jgi:hypothetical protein
MALGKKRDETGRPVDPIEQSKVGAVEHRKPEPPAAPSPIAAPAHVAEATKAKDKWPTVVTAPVAAAPVVYRVLSDKRISWESSMIKLRKGNLVGEHSHGPGCIERMRNAGVALELVKE